MLDCKDKTDVELATLSLKSQDWFFCLAKRYEDKLLRYIMRVSGFSREDAEDILQNVFIKTYYNLNGFDQRLAFSSWIYRIAHNETVSEIRKKAVRPTVFLEAEDLEKFEDTFDLVDSLDNTIDRKNINLVLGLIAEKYREVLILRYLDEKDYLEIADILHKPVSTIGNLIARGKKIFQAKYQEVIISKNI